MNLNLMNFEKLALKQVYGFAIYFLQLWLWNSQLEIFPILAWYMTSVAHGQGLHSGI